MLTGLYPPDTGSASVQGFDIGTDMLEARKVMGVCPQHDVLEPFMTVEEHLQFFASVKGCPPEEIEQEVTNIIESVGLKEKRKEYSKNLSGGQKRKLSVVSGEKQASHLHLSCNHLRRPLPSLENLKLLFWTNLPGD